MFKRILVPLDGSENAKKVLPIVVAEAQSHNAVVVLLHVIAPLRQSLMASPNLLAKISDELENINKEHLDKVAEKIRVEGLEVETIVERGQPAQLIYEIAQNKSCDLIIIGSHGETGNPRWRTGNVANKILRTQSPIPNLLVTTQFPS
jgi:nucleotide-binding universal stress UspA family protein